jgi:hypothetical protein
MTIFNFEELRKHVAHRIVCTVYNEAKVTLECDDCNEVLAEEDNPNNSAMDGIDASNACARMGERREASKNSEIGQFLRQASKLLLSAEGKDINVHSMEQTRGVESAVDEDGSWRHWPNGEWTLTVKVGFRKPEQSDG